MSSAAGMLRLKIIVSERVSETHLREISSPGRFYNNFTFSGAKDTRQFKGVSGS